MDFLKNQKSLEEFLKRHVKPYDPSTDDYDRPPFAADIKEGKNDPTYNVHSYHTKVPPRGIVPYILHYTKPGDLILDPFCGSGMTGVATQMCTNPPADILAQFSELKDRVGPRVCILNDLSPAACHIAYNYNTPVDVNALKRELERIKAAVKDEFEWLYGTEHYEPAIGDYALTNSEVLTRLKNPPNLASSKVRNNGDQGLFFSSETDRSWMLVTRSEVEERLGYPVSDLPREETWKDLDISKVEDWICIPATIQYTVWSDVYRCEGLVTIEESTGKISKKGKNAGKPILRKKKVHRGCGKEFTLWDVAVDLSNGIISDSFACPHCSQQWEKRQLQKIFDTPVIVTYESPRLVEVKGSVQVRTVRINRRPTRKELEHIHQIQSRLISDWHPTHPIDMGREMMRHGMSKQNLSNIGEFWTPRNRRALSKLWSELQETDDSRVRNALIFAFTAILFRVSRRRIVYCPKGGGWASTVISGTLYIPSLNAEANVWDSFVNKTKDILALVQVIHTDSSILVLKEDACNLDKIPPVSVDYIFADPPFGQNIYYADCSLLWEVWLDDFTDETKEIVVNERRQGGPFKTLTDYGYLMERAFREMFRVLKPNRFATIEFNNSDGTIFETIKHAILAAGFKIENMLLFDKSGKTYKQMKAVVDGEDVVDKDVLFNLHKPAVARAETCPVEHDLEQQIANSVRQHLLTLPNRIKGDPSKYSDDHRTTATINSMLMNTLIPKGVNVDRLNLPYIERVCTRYFRKVGQKWYLRGEAVGNGANGGLFLEEIEIRDEESAIAWLRQKLTSGPKTIGELKPLWMRATGLLPLEISQQLDLDALLRENFWKDGDTNRWREPTSEEREKMNDSRTLHVLRDAERFLVGSLKRQSSDSDRCDWIDVLFNACRSIEERENEELPALRDFDPGKGYQMISQLFHGILKDHLPIDMFIRAEKQARVASSRLKDVGPEEKQEKKESKNKMQQEFDW